MAPVGLEETFFVVASTDMDRVSLMTTRIREQMERVADLNAEGELDVSAAAVTLPHPESDDPLEKQVLEVANRVTEMARSATATTQNSK
jgi:hypothetical protein